MKSPKIEHPRERHYWVVSPNVKNNPKTVADWKDRSLKKRAAFMGWKPYSSKHSLGQKFAGRKNGIIHRDVILIARKFEGKPEVVGFGIVRGEFIRISELRNFKLPEGDNDSGSLRKLSPFIKCDRLPQGIPFMDVLHIKALRRLDPETSDAHKKICDWMERHLDSKDRKTEKNLRAVTKSRNEQKLGHEKVNIIALPEKYRSGYE